MKKKNTLIGKVMCVLLISLLITGCSSANDDVKGDGEANTDLQQTQNTHEDDFEIKTTYGVLYFPNQWEDYVQVDQAQENESVEVAFSGKIKEDAELVPLFSIIIGDDAGDAAAAGKLTGDDGVQRMVSVKIEEIVEDDSLSETEQNRLYAIQEELNYLIDNLK